MKRKELEALGLEKDQIDKIMELHGADVEANKALTAERDNYKMSLDAANAEISAYKSMDIDGIKKAASEWEAKAKQAETEAAQQIQNIRFETALDAAITSSRARNPKSVRALLDMEGLKMTDSGILGLKEQIAAIKKDNGFLFDPEPSEGFDITGGRPVSPNDNPSGIPAENAKMNNFIRRSAGMQTE